LTPVAGPVLVVGSYLLGSVSWSTVIVRALRGFDIRTLGSGNAGATNVLRSAGRKPAVFVLLLDLAKGAVAVLTSRALAAPPSVVAGAAFAVVLGHVFPLFFGFRGGKGVATAAGALGALAPLALVLALMLFTGVVAWKRYVSLGSMVTAACFPALAWLGAGLDRSALQGPWLLAASTAIAALVLLKHRGNLRRLLRAAEPRLGERPPAAGGSDGRGRIE
jgi:glycerol-3-phosphate acyltransferase PlsY